MHVDARGLTDSNCMFSKIVFPKAIISVIIGWHFVVNNMHIHFKGQLPGPLGTRVIGFCFKEMM